MRRVAHAAARVRGVADDSGTVPARAAGQAAEAIGGGHADAVIAAAPTGRTDAARALVHESFATGLDRICVISGPRHWWATPRWPSQVRPPGRTICRRPWCAPMSRPATPI
ncbi:hypothetical protein ABZS71_10520 [Streptomyces sp. NPDC005393]|uniref:hypothetical protein n=1 Tax=Streptomyces sp. NPDC005393 TaxID=3157041 RepID=UPI0033B3DE52